MAKSSLRGLRGADDPPSGRSPSLGRSAGRPAVTSFGSFRSFGLITEIGQLPRRQFRLGINDIFHSLPYAVVPRHLGDVKD